MGVGEGHIDRNPRGRCCCGVCGVLEFRRVGSCGILLTNYVSMMPFPTPHLNRSEFKTNIDT